MSGTSNYPEAIDNYTPLTDGVDVIQADDENNSYVAHNRVQTFLGASGAPQSHNTDVLAQLFSAKDILGTMRISYVDAGKVRASVGTLLCENVTGAIRKLRRNTAGVDITFANLDTGTEQPNTRYYVYAVADENATTVTFKISTSPTAPTGVTTFKLIGWFFNDGSSNIDPAFVASAAGLRLVQFIRAEFTNCIASGGVALPYDNTNPTPAMGAQLVTLNVQPRAANNKLEFEFYFPFSGPGGAWSEGNPCGILVEDIGGSQNVKHVAHGRTIWYGSTATGHVYGKFVYSATTVSPIIFILRFATSGVICYANGQSNGQGLFNGKSVCFLQAKEYES